MREQLAQLAHEQWSGWIKYMFGECEPTKNNELVIPRWAAERWTRQSETPYCELSEKEKDSDRAEADKFLAVFNQFQAEIKQLQVDVKRLDWLDLHTAFVADGEYFIGPYKTGELRKMADDGIAVDKAIAQALQKQRKSSPAPMKITNNQREILDHTAHGTADGLYCGDSDDMQTLVSLGLMVSMGKKSFVPDEYFALTGAGRKVQKGGS